MGRSKSEKRRSGSIRRVRRGVWEISIGRGKDSRGRWKRAYRRVHGERADAEQALADLKREDLRPGVANPALPDRLGPFVKYWQEVVLPGDVRIRPRTAAGYLGSLRRYILPTLGGRRLRSITMHDIETLAHQLHTERKLSGVTIHNTMAALRTVFRTARSHGLVSKNPVSGAVLPVSRPKRRPVWSLDEARRFLTATVDSRWSAAWRVLLVLGLRPSELRGLTWDDISFEEASLSVSRSTTWDSENRQWSTTPPKTDRSARTLPVDSETLAKLKQWKSQQAQDRLAHGHDWHQDQALFEEQLRIFLREDGRIPTDWALREALYADSRRAGVPLIPTYSLRHTSASLAFAAGVDLLVVSRRLGHATIGITADTYTRIPARAQQEATERLSQSLSKR